MEAATRAKKAEHQAITIHPHGFFLLSACVLFSLVSGVHLTKYAGPSESRLQHVTSADEG